MIEKKLNTPCKDAIHQIAEKNQIYYQETYFTKLATKFTELSGDENLLDDTVHLAISLQENDIISRKKMMALVVAYEKEKRVLKDS